MKNFRNYASETFSFEDGLNVLFGKNAQGKTNCAEAVFYLCTGTSPRARRDKQLIKHGEECAEIYAEAEGRYGGLTISAVIRENGR
ncbi:MAG: AAA family ATPase, partial [Clostridia bacterium]|nr:AAA family ATPase [Clostridia bacterium]